MNRKLNITNILKRKPLSNNFIPEIDGLRFFAIITVAIYHFKTAYFRELGIEQNELIKIFGDAESLFSFSWFLIRLDLGVKVFFSISGFVLSLPFLRVLLNPNITDKIDLKKYYIRRIKRLEPPFIISMVLFYGVHIFVLNAPPLDLLKNFFAGVFYLHTLIFGYVNPINPVTWSLETEAQFYLIFPFIVYIIFKSKNICNKIFIFISLFFISILFKHLYYYNPHIGSTVISYLSNFMIGILSAYLFLKYQSFLKIRTFFFDLLGTFSVFTLFLFYKPQTDIMNQIIFNISILFFVLSVFKGKFLNFLFTRKFVYLIGGMCYSIYLIHYALFHLIIKFTKKLLIYKTMHFDYVNFTIQLIMNLFITIIISTLFYLFFEKPFMNRK